MKEKTPSLQTQAAMTEARSMARIPDFKETVLASKALDYSSARVSNLRLELDKLKAQKSDLMYDLLTGKVPVKVAEAEVVDG